jgi:hypothetical protein
VINVALKEHRVVFSRYSKIIYAMRAPYMYNLSLHHTMCCIYTDPMNQRILDATIQAGREPVDVDATIETMFGVIPSTCRSDAVLAAPTGLNVR